MRFERWGFAPNPSKGLRPLHPRWGLRPQTPISSRHASASWHPRLFCAALLLSSCAPHLPAPDTSVQTTTYLPGQPVTTTQQPDQWWTIFQNPALNALETQGMAKNPSIDIAKQTLLAAQDAAKAANGAYLPNIILGGGGQPVVSGGAYPAGPNSSPAYTLYSPTGTISYDFGLFGTRKFTFANGAAQTEYQSAELEAARQTVAQNIAAAAIAYAGAAQQMSTTNAIIAAEQNLLHLMNGEFQAGAIPQLSLLQQQSLVQAAQATLPPLQASEDVARDRLAILTGTLPGDFSLPPPALDAFAAPATLPISLPSSYLENRPDLRAARATVAAQNAALGLATAKLYPDVNISATGGLASETLGTLFQPSAALWTLAGNLVAPLYEGGTLHAQRDQAQAQLAGALAAYRQAVLTAFGQAADALDATQQDSAALTRAQDSAHTANAAYQLANAEYRLGATDYTTVLTAEANAAQQALNVTTARVTLLEDIARLQAVMAK